MAASPAASGRSGIRVAVRTRPTAFFAADQLLIDTAKSTINVKALTSGDAVNNRQDSWAFRFHQVLHNAGQDTVYEHLCSEAVSTVVAGTNATVMAYGQTGAGKTFTMIGDTGNYKQRGVAPRAIAQLFQEIAARPEIEFTVQLSYMEIYNDRIFDLLGDPSAAPEFQIVEDKARGIIVKGLSMHSVASEEEALNLLFRGESNRTTAEHQLNKNSNRSHAIFTLHVSQRSRLGSSERVLLSKLNIVDLAGSERLKKTMEVEEAKGGIVDETTKRESMFINRSLTYLEQCVVALTTKSRAHVPYRQTKLTNVLKDSLGGNCVTILVACIWGESSHLEETISTLKLAQRMMAVRNEITVNVLDDPAALVRKYEKEIRTLKQELLMHDAMVDRSGVNYDEYTPEQKREVATQVKAWLQAAPGSPDDHIEFDSVRRMNEILAQVKIFVKRIEVETEERLRAQFELAPRKAGGVGVTASTASVVAAGGGAGGGGGSGDGGGGVGEVDADSGYGIGIAPAGARPTTMDVARPARAAGVGARSPQRPGVAGGAGLGATGADGKEDAIPSDQNAAFRMWRERPDLGATLSSEAAAAKTSLREARERLKAGAVVVNAAKKTVEELQTALDAKRRESSALDVGKESEGEKVVDEEEFRLIKQLSDAKKDYKAKFNEIRTLKGDASHAADVYDELRGRMLAEFEAWWVAHGGAEGLGLSVGGPGGLSAIGVGGAGAGGVDHNEDGDVLDDGEAFDKMESERVAAEDPDALAFFNAKKKLRGTHTMTRKARG